MPPKALPRAARLTIAAGAIAAAIAVAVGAFAAHALRTRLGADALALVDTGSRYQLIHALALIACGLLHAWRPSRLTVRAAGLFAAGIALFCGSLYALGLGAPRSLGIIAPAGGLSLIAGWLLLATAALRST